MKLRYRVSLILVVVLVLTVGAALSTVGIIARSRGVSRVSPPSGSMIAQKAIGADYVDSYAATVPGTLFLDTRTLERYAFQRCTVAAETDDEIMYTGESPGLVYHVSYLCRSEGSDAKLYVSTTVSYRSWQGWVYFAFVRPAHRVLVPFMVTTAVQQWSVRSQKGGCPTES